MSVTDVLVGSLSAKDITKIGGNIKSLMLASFPAELEMAQPSLSCQKELLDREVVGQAIMMLMEHSGNPIVYSNESDICANPGFNFIPSTIHKKKGFYRTDEILLFFTGTTSTSSSSLLTS